MEYKAGAKATFKLDGTMARAKINTAEAEDARGDLELRRLALDCAVRSHGPDAIAADVIETANAYHRWLRHAPKTKRTRSADGALSPETP